MFPKTYHIKNYDFFLVLVAIAISVYGIVIIGSARESVSKPEVAVL